MGVGGRHLNRVPTDQRVLAQVVFKRARGHDLGDENDLLLVAVHPRVVVLYHILCDR